MWWYIQSVLCSLHIMKCEECKKIEKYGKAVE